MSAASANSGFCQVPRPSDGPSREQQDPFPIALLPEPVAAMVNAISRSRAISDDVAAALSLAACASAIGLSRIAYDSFADWSEPAIIWLVVVVRSGSRKSIVIEDLFGPHHDRQRRAAETFEGRLAEFHQEMENWKVRNRKKKSEAEPKPSQPVLEHVYTSDSTPEALTEVLKVTDRGILVLADELAHFFGGFGAYTGKAERDRSFYLSLFRAIQFKCDRKGAGTTFVTNAGSSIVGGVQPLILGQCFDDESYASGLVSRFLLVDAPPQIKEYSQGPTPEEKTRYARFIDGLFGLKMDPYMREDGVVGWRPLQVPISEEARDLLRGFVPDWSEESLLESADVEAAMSKLEGYAIRFALILRVCREITGGALPEDPITREDLEAGIRIARWFKNGAKRIYADLGAGDQALGRDRLLARAEVIRRRFGGAVTAREWRKVNNRRSPEEATGELDELVTAEMGVWRDRPPGPSGGRPTKECALVDRSQPLAEEGSGVSGFGLRGAGRESAKQADIHGLGSDEVSGCRVAEIEDPRSQIPSGAPENGGDGPATPTQPATRNPKPGQEALPDEGRCQTDQGLPETLRQRLERNKPAVLTLLSLAGSDCEIETDFGRLDGDADRAGGPPE